MPSGISTDFGAAVVHGAWGERFKVASARAALFGSQLTWLSLQIRSPSGGCACNESRPIWVIIKAPDYWRLPYHQATVVLLHAPRCWQQPFHAGTAAISTAEALAHGCKAGIAIQRQKGGLLVVWN